MKQLMYENVQQAEKLPCFLFCCKNIIFVKAKR